MRVAAYQAPLLPTGSMDALALIAEQLRACEAAGVEVLVCPEAVLGGLADYAPTPADIALTVPELRARLEPMAGSAVTMLIGFTEANGSALYNSAAVVSRGEIIAVYRKQRPARRASVYSAGVDSLVFNASRVTFGVLICNDTNHSDLATTLAAQGVQAILIPSNNALRPELAEVVEETRAADLSLARRFGVATVRADVAGLQDGRIANGTSAIIDAEGRVLAAGPRRAEALLIADLPL